MIETTCFFGIRYAKRKIPLLKKSKDEAATVVKKTRRRMGNSAGKKESGKMQTEFAKTVVAEKISRTRSPEYANGGDVPDMPDGMVGYFD
jgi:hypothetical protein